MNVPLAWFYFDAFPYPFKTDLFKSKSLTKINVCWQTRCRQQAYPLPLSDSVCLAAIPQAF